MKRSTKPHPRTSHTKAGGATKKSRKSRLHAPIVAGLLAASVFAPKGAQGHGGEQHAAKPKISYAKAEETAFGKAADPGKAKRVVVHMSDAMRFSPAEIVVRQGDIVRFEVTNAGRVMHEMVLGTKKELEEHAELMKKFPDMEHDEPHMVHVPPGKSGAMGWQFTKAGEFLFACLIPGHFEAGMVGRVIVREGGGQGGSSPALGAVGKERR